MLTAVFLSRGRTGGLTTQLIAALAHASAHILTAVVSLVLLELGVETCIRYSSAAMQPYSHTACAEALELPAFIMLLDMKGELKTSVLALLMAA